MYVAEELDAPEEQKESEITEKEESQPTLTAADVIKTWIKTTLATVALFLFLITFVVQGFSVYGSCMEPNLRTGERVLGNKLIYRFTTPSRGDIIVFRYPKDPSKTYIKRVIGLPGETIEIRQGHVFINEKPLKEPYVINTPHDSYGPVYVEPGKFFVMGDYRDQSNDSRYWGELPIRNVEAKAWIRYWPVRRATLVR